MEGIDYSFEKQLFGKRNDIEDDTVIFQIYSDANLDDVYVGMITSLSCHGKMAQKLPFICTI